MVPAAALVLAATLIFVAFAVPVVTIRIARRGERRISAERGDLAAASLEVLEGSPEIMVAGATEARLAALAAIDRRLAAAEARTCDQAAECRDQLPVALRARMGLPELQGS